MSFVLKMDNQQFSMVYNAIEGVLKYFKRGDSFKIYEENDIVYFKYNEEIVLQGEPSLEKFNVHKVNESIMTSDFINDVNNAVVALASIKGIKIKGIWIRLEKDSLQTGEVYTSTEKGSFDLLLY